MGVVNVVAPLSYFFIRFLIFTLSYWYIILVIGFFEARVKNELSGKSNVNEKRNVIKRIKPPKGKKNNFKNGYKLNGKKYVTNYFNSPKTIKI